MTGERSQHPPNLALRQARERMRMTRSEFARALSDTVWRHDRCHPGVSAVTVKNWETGKARPRRTDRVIDAACELTALNAAQLGLDHDVPCTGGLTALSVESAYPPPSIEEPPSQRRDFLAGTLGITLPTAPQPTRVDLGDVRQLVEGIAVLRRQDQLVGGDSLAPVARRLLERGRALLGVNTCAEKVRRALYSAVGQVAVDAGWLYFDRHELTTARHLYHEALTAAVLSHDDPVAAHAWANLALHAQSSGRPREAIAYLHAAQNVLGQWASAPLRALLLGREAGQWAALGDMTRFQRCSGQAREEFEPVWTPETDWASFVDVGELNMMEGNGLASGGRHDAALERFTLAAADVSPERPRNAVARELRLARAHVAVGDVRGGALRGGAVLDQALRMDSGGLRDSLGQLRTALARHPRIPAAREFEDQVRESLRA